MSDSITYKGEVLGSLHYWEYAEGKLPGHNNDRYLRLNDIEALETLLRLDDGDELLLGSTRMPYSQFKIDYLNAVRDVHFEHTRNPTTLAEIAEARRRRGIREVTSLA